MATKKEKLKFYRLVTRPSYAATFSAGIISGYINRYDEFKQFDIDPLNESSGSYLGPAPKHFFGNYQVNLSGVSTADYYKSLEFIIDGVYAAYSRTRFNLESFAPKVYVLENSRDGIYGRPYLAPSEDSARKKYNNQVVTAPTSITFYVNPTRISIQKSKFFQKIRTRAGWAFQHWGPEIGEIQIEGNTGNISPPPQIAFGSIVGVPIIPHVVDEVPNEQNSPAYAAFRKLEQWYDEDQNGTAQTAGHLSALDYRGRLYVGHFADFQFEERGTNPFQIYYRIRFLIHYDAGNLNAATGRARSQITRNEETIRTIQELRKAMLENESASESDIR